MSVLNLKNKKKPILITGGAGFLGSHMVALCLERKINVEVIDNLSTSNLTNLKKLESHFKTEIPFFKIDLRDQKKLESFFNNHTFDAVIHFAGLKSISESILNPILYYENNVVASKNLIKNIKLHNIQNVIFSSSANVYGQPKYLPLDEKHPLDPNNPYGKNKVEVENLFLNDAELKKMASIKILRYFNPVGSYFGIIGENIKFTTSSNLFSQILLTSLKKNKFLKVFGNDYETKDGTGIRDYIHVIDLVDAHVTALNYNKKGVDIFNVGCGKGYSVSEVISEFEKANNIKIPFKILKRRIGDVDISFADVTKINKILNWKSKYSLFKMCKDSWLNYKQ